MLLKLGRVAERPPQAASTTDEYEFRLVCRRAREMFNTWLNDGTTAGGRTHNPAYLHPEDLRRLGVAPGEVVEIASAHAAVHAVVEADEHLLPGLVSISHGFGQLDPDGDDRSLDPRAFGTSVSRLLRDDDRFDPYSGMPPMSNIPVRVRPAESEPAAAATSGGRR
jgi:anaerobic selenocysteine-containing dehydrogenase